MSTLLISRIVESAKLPVRATEGAAGYDLFAAAPTMVPAWSRQLVPTGLSITVPEGTYGRIAPRSGLAWKHCIDTGAGVVDSDYTGEVKILLVNNSGVDYLVQAGERVAQMIFECVITPRVIVVGEHIATERGNGAFGSTGL